VINPHTRVSQSRWNDLYRSDLFDDKKYYFTYTIQVRCINLNPINLSKKQLNLYKKICELKDEGLTYKKISDKLNELGFEPTRGKVGDFTPPKVWSNYTKIKKNQERKVEITSLEVNNVNLVWE
jgi:hypothetical protein